MERSTARCMYNLSKYYSKASLDAETAENILGSLTVARLETKNIIGCLTVARLETKSVSWKLEPGHKSTLFCKITP